MNLRTRTLLAILSIVLPVTAAFGAFWDPHITSGKVRSDYVDNYGHGSNIYLWYVGNGLPGAEGCLFNAADAPFFRCAGRRPPTYPADSDWWQGGLQPRAGCGGSLTGVGDSWAGCLQYSTNTHFEINSPGSTYWVIHANNDPSFDQCRAGPPGASEIILDPTVNSSPNLYKMSVTGTTDKTIDIIVDSGDHDFYCSQLGAYQRTEPFLSVGAHSNKGNGQTVGYVSNSGTSTGTDILHFKAQINAHVTAGCALGTTSICNATTLVPGAHSGVIMIATWSGMRHMLYLDLFGEGSINNLNQTHFLTGNWNWPMTDSMFWPGAELALLNPSIAHSLCGITTPATLAAGNPGAEQTYSFSMSALFKCASDNGYFPDAMPTGSLPVEAVDWYIEAVGTLGEVDLGVREIYNDGTI